MISRRSFLARTTGGALLVLAGQRDLAALAAPVVITVYKDPGCGCCKSWIDHVKSAGFATDVHDDLAMDAVKDRLGVPAPMRSCHTARVGGYLVEGHVPASDIQRMLKEKPAIAGLAVPGMPMSAPGMAQPGAPITPYQVIAFERGGATRVYARYT